MKKTSFICFVLIFYLTSCIKINIYPILDTDKYVYEEGETLSYNSQIHVDTFVVSGNTVYSNYYETDHEETYNGVLGVGFKIITTDSIKKRRCHSSIEIIRSIYNCSFDLNWITLSSHISNAKYVGRFPIHDVLVDSVYYCEGEKDKLMLENSIRSAMFCKRLGVLRYETFAGETFIMDKEVLHKYSRLLLY